MLIVLEIEQSSEWDAIVSSFKKYDIYWLVDMLKHSSHGDGKPILLYYEDRILVVLTL